MKGKLPYWLTKQIDGRIKHRLPFPIVKLDEIRLREGKTCSIEIDSQSSRINIGSDLKIEVTDVWKKFGIIHFKGQLKDSHQSICGNGRWDARSKTGIWYM